MAWTQVSNLKGPAGDPGDPGPSITVWDADAADEPMDAVPGDVWIVPAGPEETLHVTSYPDPPPDTYDVSEGDIVGFTAIAAGGTEPYTYGLTPYAPTDIPDGAYTDVGTWPTGFYVDSASGEVTYRSTAGPGENPSLSVYVSDADGNYGRLPPFTLTVTNSGG